MGRNTGQIGLDKLEFVQRYAELSEQYGDPLTVMFKLSASRKQSMKFQATRELLSYRYPKQAVAKLEIETPGQMTLQWEMTTDEQPAELIEINPKELIND